MKPKLLILIILLVISFNSRAQSLSPERVKHIKESTVRITIEGSNSIGTGFFISPEGTLLTCWHVIEPAILRDAVSNNIIGARKMFVILSNGEKLQFDIPNVVLKAYNNAISYDFCFLIPIKQHLPFPYLKLGNFNNVKEGQEIYTCGYPLAIEQQFVTKGILSTKYIDTANSIKTGTATTKMPRNQALLDLTMNKGNSGGAVIAVGKNIEDDEVIGVADFIINPIGGNAQALAKILKDNSGGVFISGVDTNLLFSNIIEVLNSTSVGISGCVSINHAIEGLELITH